MATTANNSWRWFVVAQILSLSVIAFLGFKLAKPSASQVPPYAHLATRLFISHAKDIIINFTGLRNDLRAYTAAAGVPIGIYFEYLPTGTSINVGGNDEFFRASLIKLPVVMRAYKFIEEGLLTLDTTLTLESKHIDESFGTLWKQGAGATLSVREAIQYVLRDSDNTAFNVLYDKVNVDLRQDSPTGDASADDVYDYLDIPRAASGITPMITPKNYSSILKSLYFSAYLSYAHSEEILQTLVEPKPTLWLRDGIRPGIDVANKIGIYETDPIEWHVHSDCGIVYYPDRTYSLCVMVKSKDTPASIEHIRKISKAVFDYVQNRP